MAKESLQDKFQITVPYNPNDDSSADGSEWIWPATKILRTRPLKGSYSDGLISDFSLGPKNSQPTPQKDPVPAVSKAAASSNPPNWTDELEWVIRENGGAPLVTASDSDVTNKMMDAKSLLHGFTLHDLGNTDDQYTGEGVDLFYGDAEGKDDANNKYTGFVERNNYLDRN